MPVPISGNMQAIRQDNAWYSHHMPPPRAMVLPESPRHRQEPQLKPGSIEDVERILWQQTSLGRFRIPSIQAFALLYNYPYVYICIYIYMYQLM